MMDLAKQNIDYLSFNLYKFSIQYTMIGDEYTFSMNRTLTGVYKRDNILFRQHCHSKVLFSYVRIFTNGCLTGFGIVPAIFIGLKGEIIGWSILERKPGWYCCGITFD